MKIDYLSGTNTDPVIEKEIADVKQKKSTDVKDRGGRSTDKIDNVDHSFRYLSQTRPNIVGKVRIYDQFEEVLADRDLLKDGDDVCLNGTYYKVHLHDVQNSALSEQAELARQQKKHPSWMFLDVDITEVGDIEKTARKKNLEGELSRLDDNTFDKGAKYKEIEVLSHLPKLNHRISQYVVYMKVKGKFLYFYNINGASFGHIRITDAGHNIIKRHFEFRQSHGKGEKKPGQSRKKRITSWTRDLLKIINTEINKDDVWEPVIEIIGECIREILGDKFYIERY